MLPRFCEYCGQLTCACKKPSNSLTSMELRVSRKLAEGCSNKEISAHLGMGTETVKRHLSNIFNKTGASSRLELAVWIISDEYEIELAGLRKEIEALKKHE